MSFTRTHTTSAEDQESLLFSRREACKFFAGAGIAAAAITASLFKPHIAFGATTQAQIDAAKSDADAAQKLLDEIANEVSSMQASLNDTNSQIGSVSDQIDSKQKQIDSKQVEINDKEEQIAEKRKALGARMSSNYKAGPSGALEMILSSASFEELTSNIYYLDKISESDQKMIEEVKELKDRLEADKAQLQTEKADLENQKTQLESLRSSQQAQLSDISARQADAANVVANLDANVRDLIAQRDSELLAAQQEAERVAAQRSASSSSSGSSYSGGGSSYSGGGSSYSGGGSSYSAGSGSAAAVVSAANYTGSTGAGFCAAWVSNVFSNAGVGHFYGNACDMYYRYCTSTDRSSIQPGMIIAVPSLGGSAAALIYGHVGIYIGGGMVRHCLSGNVITQSLSSWISNLGALSTPRWGWLGGVVLS